MVKTRRQASSTGSIAGSQVLPVELQEKVVMHHEDNEDIAAVRLLCKSAAAAGRAAVRRILKESISQRQLERFMPLFSNLHQLQLSSPLCTRHTRALRQLTMGGKLAGYTSLSIHGLYSRASAGFDLTLQASSVISIMAQLSRLHIELHLDFNNYTIKVPDTRHMGGYGTQIKLLTLRGEFPEPDVGKTEMRDSSGISQVMQMLPALVAVGINSTINIRDPSLLVSCLDRAKVTYQVLEDGRRVVASKGDTDTLYTPGPWGVKWDRMISRRNDWRDNHADFEHNSAW
ncbi:hypothetical protein WJX73_006557 [Symbiochloris irregularis]|uniref:Uncharacterized protein n=1 Tax=Symbiochloris irregularis TaxID=706552 RepID=A0AAW1NRV7_9CHLO